MYHYDIYRFMRSIGPAILVACLTLDAGPVALSQARTGQWLLAQAAETFDRNRGQEHFWNKTSHETWSATDSRGRILQQFPAVTVESVVRKDGTRCNAVVAWSDGVPAHMLRADEDARCASVGETESDKFEVAA